MDVAIVTLPLLGVHRNHGGTAGMVNDIERGTMAIR